MSCGCSRVFIVVTVFLEDEDLSEFLIGAGPRTRARPRFFFYVASFGRCPMVCPVAWATISTTFADGLGIFLSA